MARKAAVAEVAGRRCWREAEARVVVAGWRASGESLTAFARRHGLGPQRIGWWAKARRRTRAGTGARPSDACDER
jgi:hypothetical protein